MAQHNSRRQNSSDDTESLQKAEDTGRGQRRDLPHAHLTHDQNDRERDTSKLLSMDVLKSAVIGKGLKIAHINITNCLLKIEELRLIRSASGHSVGERNILR